MIGRLKWCILYTESHFQLVILGFSIENNSGWTELGGRGGTGPPSFLDLCSKNYKISQIREENSFFYLVVPPHKKFASVHPDGILIHLVVE